MFIRASDREYVPTILADYVERYHRPYHSICDEKLTEDDAVAMVIFYFRVVMPFVRKYLNFAIESDNAPNHQDYPIVPLRKAEKTRIFRAFYRFQICCNLFWRGRPRREKGTAISLRQQIHPATLLLHIPALGIGGDSLHLLLLDRTL